MSYVHSSDVQDSVKVLITETSFFLSHPSYRDTVTLTHAPQCLAQRWITLYPNNYEVNNYDKLINEYNRN